MVRVASTLIAYAAQSQGHGRDLSFAAHLPRGAASICVKFTGASGLPDSVASVSAMVTRYSASSSIGTGLPKKNPCARLH